MREQKSRLFHVRYTVPKKHQSSHGVSVEHGRLQKFLLPPTEKKLN